jgi:deoxyguanosine kinase
MRKDARIPWIAIDGCVGAGKTTLARVVAETLNVNFEQEKSDKHPFLEDFYAAPSETALQTELGFVLIHYHQIAQVVLRCRTTIITDFTLAKDMLFARMNLSGDELSLFRSVYNYFSALTTPPTLLVKLDATDKLLWRRVKLRDRTFERQMKREYLQRLNREYAALAEVSGADNVITLRADDYDIVNDEQDRDRIVAQIAKAAGIPL